MPILQCILPFPFYLCNCSYVLFSIIVKAETNTHGDTDRHRDLSSVYSLSQMPPAAGAKQAKARIRTSIEVSCVAGRLLSRHLLPPRPCRNPVSSVFEPKRSNSGHLCPRWVLQRYSKHQNSYSSVVLIFILHNSLLNPFLYLNILLYHEVKIFKVIILHI